MDLHSFEGLSKADAPVLRPTEYAAWKADPAGFTLDGAAPVLDLWARAAEAWVDLFPLSPSPCAPTAQLVVAHNAINQALVATAVGLPPTAFRRLAQGNGGVTTLSFPTPSTVAVRGLNVTPALALAPRKERGKGKDGGGLVAWLAVAPPDRPPPLPAALAGLAPHVLVHCGSVSKTVAVAVAAGVGAGGVAAADDAWAAAAAAAAAGRSPVVLALAPPAVVAAALAAAVGARGLPFSVDAGSVSLVEVAAGDARGARAVLRTTNWSESGWGVL
jgi:hypothetical protein